MQKNRDILLYEVNRPSLSSQLKAMKEAFQGDEESRLKYSEGIRSQPTLDLSEEEKRIFTFKLPDYQQKLIISSKAIEFFFNRSSSFWKIVRANHNGEGKLCVTLDDNRNIIIQSIVSEVVEQTYVTLRLENDEGLFIELDLVLNPTYSDLFYVEIVKEYYQPYQMQTFRFPSLGVKKSSPSSLRYFMLTLPGMDYLQEDSYLGNYTLTSPLRDEDVSARFFVYNQETRELKQGTLLFHQDPYITTSDILISELVYQGSLFYEEEFQHVALHSQPKYGEVALSQNNKGYVYKRTAFVTKDNREDDFTLMLSSSKGVCFQRIKLIWAPEEKQQINTIKVYLQGNHQNLWKGYLPFDKEHGCLLEIPGYGINNQGVYVLQYEEGLFLLDPLTRKWSYRYQGDKICFEHTITYHVIDDIGHVTIWNLCLSLPIYDAGIVFLDSQAQESIQLPSLGFEDKEQVRFDLLTNYTPLSGSISQVTKTADPGIFAISQNYDDNQSLSEFCYKVSLSQNCYRIGKMFVQELIPDLPNTSCLLNDSLNSQIELFFSDYKIEKQPRYGVVFLEDKQLSYLMHVDYRDKNIQDRVVLKRKGTRQPEFYVVDFINPKKMIWEAFDLIVDVLPYEPKIILLSQEHDLKQAFYKIEKYPQHARIVIDSSTGKVIYTHCKGSYEEDFFVYSISYQGEIKEGSVACIPVRSFTVDTSQIGLCSSTLSLETSYLTTKYISTDCFGKGILSIRDRDYFDDGTLKLSFCDGVNLFSHKHFKRNLSVIIDRHHPIDPIVINPLTTIVAVLKESGMSLQEAKKITSTYFNLDRIQKSEYDVDLLSLSLLLWVILDIFMVLEGNDSYEYGWNLIADYMKRHLSDSHPIFNPEELITSVSIQDKKEDVSIAIDWLHQFIQSLGVIAKEESLEQQKELLEKLYQVESSFYDIITSQERVQNLNELFKERMSFKI